MLIFFLRVFQERSVFYEVVPGEAFLLEHRLCPVTITPPDPHTHISFIYYRQYTILYTDNVDSNKVREINNSSTHILCRQLVAWTRLKIENPRKQASIFSNLYFTDLPTIRRCRL